MYLVQSQSCFLQSEFSILGEYKVFSISEKNTKTKVKGEDIHRLDGKRMYDNAAVQINYGWTLEEGEIGSEQEDEGNERGR